MSLRQTPYKLMAKCVQKLNKNNLTVEIQTLEAHHLSGGNILDIIDGMVFAKNNNLEVSFQDLVFLDLTQNPILQTLEECLETNEAEFRTYEKDGNDLIFGLMQDGSKHNGIIRVTYRNNVRAPLGYGIYIVQEQLALKLSVLIHSSKNKNEFLIKTNEYEARLLKLGIDIYKELEKIEITLS
jgi:uncharacterized protein YqfA (UPF0365 family)